MTSLVVFTCDVSVVMATASTDTATRETNGVYFGPVSTPYNVNFGDRFMLITLQYIC